MTESENEQPLNKEKHSGIGETEHTWSFQSNDTQQRRGEGNHYLS